MVGLRSRDDEMPSEIEINWGNNYGETIFAAAPAGVPGL